MSRWAHFFDGADRSIFKQCWHSRRLIELIVEKTPKGGRILEAGCGTGLLSVILADLGFKVTALDLDKEVLEQAKKRVCLNNLCLDYVQGDILNISSLFPHKHFDAVCHSGVMEHFSDEDIVKSLSGQRNVAKKVIFNVPNNRNKLTGKHFGDERFLSNRKWFRLIKKAGFQKIKVFGGYDKVIYIYFLLPGAFFHRKASFWWKYFSRHSVFICE